MKELALKEKGLLFFTLTIGFCLAVSFRIHYYNQNLCPGTEYKIIDEVTYCDYQGNLFKPKVYRRLIK